MPTHARVQVRWCDGAEETFNEALDKACSGNPKRIQTFRDRVARYIERLETGQQLSAANFPHEGYLPNGHPFYAIKKIPIRLYCWFSRTKPGVLFISHAYYKKQQKRPPDQAAQVYRRYLMYEGRITR
ncbi:MAG: hypothetical protein U5R48_06225 [Gammaproteobacteria bacterium]|nr:hypothetical protein [Gammaproteobacteria bacterium]